MNNELIELARTGSADALYELALEWLKDNRNKKRTLEELKKVRSITDINLLLKVIEECISSYPSWYYIRFSLCLPGTTDPLETPKREWAKIKANSSNVEELFDNASDFLITNYSFENIFRIIAVSWLFKAAEKGNADAQYHLALIHTIAFDKWDNNYYKRLLRFDNNYPIMYVFDDIEKIIKRSNHGENKKKKRVINYFDMKNDPELISNWFLNAAEKGVVDAQYAVGKYLLWSDAKNIKDRYETAAKWLIVSGENKRDTFMSIASLIIKEVDQKDLNSDIYNKARIFINRGLEEDIKNSNNLAKTYCDIGEGFLKGEFPSYSERNVWYSFYTDYEEAIKNLTKAADLEYFDAIYKLGRLYYFGDAVFHPRDYSKDNTTKIMEKIGLQHNFNPNIKKAAEYFIKLSEKRKGCSRDMLQAIAEVQEYLGFIYSRGNGGIDKDENKAEEWFIKACENAIDNYQLNYKKLGDYYYSGASGIPQDYKRAFDCYSKAALYYYDDSKSEALYKLGEIFFNGYGVEKDYERALHFFLKAGEAGDNSGFKMVGKMYFNGLGTERNEKLADYYFEMAHNKRRYDDYDDYDDSPRLRDGISKGPDGEYYDDDGNWVDSDYAYGDD